MDKQYDGVIKEQAVLFTSIDWRLLKALMYVESGLDSSLVTENGVGLAQVTADRWEYTQDHANPPTHDLLDPETSVFTLAYCLGLEYDKWKGIEFEREHDKIKLVIASYKSSFEDVWEAYELSGKKQTYAQIGSYLTDVLDTEGINLIRFIQDVFKAYQEMFWGSLK